MKRISPAVVLAASFIAWPHVSFSCDGVTIGPCAPGGPWKGSVSGLESHDEPTRTEQVLDTIGSLGKQAIDDTTYLLTSPLRIDGKSALIVGGIATGIGGLMVADKTIQRAFQENRTDTNDEIAKTFETFGFSRTVLGANVALIGAGWLFRQHEEGNKLMRTALVSLESQMFVEGIASLTKFAVGRAPDWAHRPTNHSKGSTNPFHQAMQPEASPWPPYLRTPIRSRSRSWSIQALH